jgi:hypothetical protein
MRQEFRSGLGLTVLAFGLGGVWTGCALESETDSDDVAVGDEEAVAEDDAAIVGGVGAPEGHGAAKLRTRPSSTSDQWSPLACTATLLDSRWAITEAACLWADIERTPSRLDLQLPPSPTFHQAIEIVRNPSGGQALIRLASPVPIDPTAVRHISAVPGGWIQGRTVRCYGYGDGSSVPLGNARQRDTTVAGWLGSSFVEYVLTDPIVQLGDGGGPCLEGDMLLGTLNFDWNGSYMDGAPMARGWEGMARTTQNIVSLESGVCLDVGYLSTADGAAVTTYYCQNWENQDFRLVELGAGDYQIRARHSGKCIGVAPGSGANAAVVQQTCDRAGTVGPWQVFRMQNDGVLTATVKLIHKQTNLCVDRGTSSGIHTTVQLKSCDSTSRQRWSMPGNPVELNGAQHSLSNNYDWEGCLIQPSGWTSFDMQPCHPAEGQQITASVASGGFHRLQLRGSGQCVSVSGGSTAEGAAVVPSACVNGAPSQEWKLMRKPTGYEVRARHSNKCLTRNPQSNGQEPITQAICTGYTNQIWSWE